MASLIKGESQDRLIDAAGLRAMLEGCRHEIDTVRHDAAFGDDGRVGGVATGLELRLKNIAERLERATRALDRFVGSGAAAASSPDSAYMFVREADHRIKNSLQAVISLLDRQANRTKAEAARDALRVATARVAAIAEVHAALHAAPRQYGIEAKLDLATYLGGLCTALRGAFGVDGEYRVLHVEVEPLTISSAAAQSLGLAVTELVTNALRHAFHPAKPGTVRVTGRYRGDGWYQLCVEDDGKGLPRDFDLRLRPSGLGLRMVNMLADQLRARLTVAGGAGACFVLTVPVAGIARAADPSPPPHGPTVETSGRFPRVRRVNG
jgi:two-component sensor histidine kinase